MTTPSCTRPPFLSKASFIRASAHRRRRVHVFSSIWEVHKDDGDLTHLQVAAQTTEGQQRLLYDQHARLEGQAERIVEPTALAQHVYCINAARTPGRDDRLVRFASTL
jgi:hypothetical protein